FFQAEDGIREFHVTGVQTCALPIFVNGLQAALGLGAVTAVADYAAIHPIWALGAAAVGAGGTLLVRGMQSPNRVIADLARWAGAGGWSFSLLSGLADWSVGSVAT